MCVCVCFSSTCCLSVLQILYSSESGKNIYKRHVLLVSHMVTIIYDTTKFYVIFTFCLVIYEFCDNEPNFISSNGVGDFFPILIVKGFYSVS